MCDVFNITDCSLGVSDGSCVVKPVWMWSEKLGKIEKFEVNYVWCFDYNLESFVC